MAGCVHIRRQPRVAHLIAAIGQQRLTAPGGIIVALQLKQLCQRALFAGRNGAQCHALYDRHYPVFPPPGIAEMAGVAPRHSSVPPVFHPCISPLGRKKITFSPIAYILFLSNIRHSG
jgi:hypothetical protein